MGKHGPLEVLCNALTDVPGVWHRHCSLGDELLERHFQFKYPNPLFCVTESARRDIDEDEWTETEDLVYGGINNGEYLTRSGIICP